MIDGPKDGYGSETYDDPEDDNGDDGDEAMPGSTDLFGEKDFETTWDLGGGRPSRRGKSSRNEAPNRRLLHEPDLGGRLCRSRHRPGRLARRPLQWLAIGLDWRPSACSRKRRPARKAACASTCRRRLCHAAGGASVHGYC